MGGWPLAYAAVLALGATGALVGFQAAMRPNLEDLAAKIPVDWFGNLLLAGVCFSVINAVLEELIFRYLLWRIVSEEWNQGTALLVTTLLFGIGHMQGYPPGALGATLAGLYGLSLGVLRWWTNGLGLCTACHIGADATIFCLISASGAFDAT